MNEKKGHIDWFILLPIILLMFFSLAFVYSASATVSEDKFGGETALFWNHSIRVLFAFLVMIIFAMIDYHTWAKLSKPIIVTSLILLIIVLISGTAAKGATRWLNLGFISIQPSEIAKFALVLHFAKLLVDKQDRIKSFEKGFLPFLVWIGLISLFVAMQPNFSTMGILIIISLSMLFIGNANILHLAGTFILGILVLGVYAVSAEYRLNRLLAFFGSDSSSSDSVSYQLNQALIALGNGGMTGVGVGQNKQSHMFLPESYGDFIFSVIGEEMGFIGLFIILLAFGMVLWRGFVIAKNAPDDFGYFLAFGIVITFAVYVFVNAGVNTGLLPTTGVPMPFLSYGGTAVLIYAAAIGTLLNISAQAGIYPREIPVSDNIADNNIEENLNNFDNKIE